MARATQRLVDGSSWHDADYLNDLLDAIDADPTAIEARYLLAERYLALGWDEAAGILARHILELQPDHDAALAILLSSGGHIESVPPSPNSPRPSSVTRKPITPINSTSSKTKSGKQPAGEKASAAELNGLRDGYQSLQRDAANLLAEIMVFQDLAPSFNCVSLLSSLETILVGRVQSTSKGRSGAPSSKPKAAAPQPKSSKELAAAMKSDLSRAPDIVIEEFRNHPQPKAVVGADKPADEILRDAVRKRAEELKPLLPQTLSHCASDAVMHIEHEFLGRTYVNNETMIMGESLSEIPREQFFVSEDGYAWDISELVQAIKTNGGVMRNPLSKDSFTVADVEAILRHPLGKELAALQIEQSKLFQGVRPDTVAKLESMGKVLLGDDAEDSRISREAVDDFFNYVATLPSVERKAIDKLRVPARDSHTGKAFDATIGDALRDAKANLLCFHKAGDLCQQAAVYLKDNGRTSGSERRR